MARAVLSGRAYTSNVPFIGYDSLAEHCLVAIKGIIPSVRVRTDVYFSGEFTSFELVRVDLRSCVLPQVVVLVASRMFPVFCTLMLLDLW